MDIGWIQKKVKSGKYLWTLHADVERRNDGLEIDDVEKALLGGTVLENYPNDPRGRSCLVCGENNGVPMHVVCGRNKADMLVIITIYKPISPKWLSPTERRKK